MTDTRGHLIGLVRVGPHEVEDLVTVRDPDVDGAVHLLDEGVDERLGDEADVDPFQRPACEGQDLGAGEVPAVFVHRDEPPVEKGGEDAVRGGLGQPCRLDDVGEARVRERRLEDEEGLGARPCCDVRWCEHRAGVAARAAVLVVPVVALPLVRVVIVVFRSAQTVGGQRMSAMAKPSMSSKD